MRLRQHISDDASSGDDNATTASQVFPSSLSSRSKWARRRRFTALTCAAALFLAACGDDDDAENGTGSDGNLSNGFGSINISGSSTVEPISSLVAEGFQGQVEDLAIAVNGPGTGDGFEVFCNGETDISDASRPIKDAEKEACEKNGVSYVELKVGIDGISVLTSPENDAVSCLGYEDLYALTSMEATGMKNWSEAQDLAEELGSRHTPYPDAKLFITGPGEESGTFDTFVEFVIEDFAEDRGQEATTRPDYEALPNDNVIIQGVANETTSLGWVGFAFFSENKESVKAIEVDGGDGICVAPTPATISAGTYPLSRPLFIYVNTDKAAKNETLTQFVDYYLSDEGIANVTNAGYVMLEDSALNETRTVWESR